MKKNNWKNKTLQLANIRIQITNNHIHAKGEWVMHVRELGWNCKPLKIPNDSTEEEAQKEAVKIVEKHLDKMIKSLIEHF